MPQDRHDGMVRLYRRIADKAECVIVCHHIDELREAQDEFPDLEVRYGYDEHQYEGLYSDVDFVVSPKVHGVGICASMGIGGVLLPTDERRGTVEGFLAGCTWDESEIDGLMERCAEQSAMLKAHRERTWDRYMEILTDWRSRWENAR